MAPGTGVTVAGRSSHHHIRDFTQSVNVVEENNGCLLYDLHLRTHSTVQSPSWAANWFAASQEIPRILRKPKVHYRTHKRPPPVPILGQGYTNALHAQYTKF